MAKRRRTRRNNQPQGVAEDRAATPAQLENPFESVQRTAFGGFQSLLVALSIALGVFSFFMVMDGDARGAQLVPHLLCAVGAVCGVGFFASKPYPKLKRAFQISAAALSALGIAGLAITSGAS